MIKDDVAINIVEYHDVSLFPAWWKSEYPYLVRAQFSMLVDYFDKYVISFDGQLNCV